MWLAHVAYASRPEPLGLGIGLGDHHVLGLGEERLGDVRVVPPRIVAMPLPELAVPVEVRLAVGELAEERGVVAVARGELDRLAVRAREPERRLGLLHRLVCEARPLRTAYTCRCNSASFLAGGEEPVERLPVFLARLLDALQAEDPATRSATRRGRRRARGARRTAGRACRPRCRSGRGRTRAGRR